jgi:REP element-mobilizing transposase RayT
MLLTTNVEGKKSIFQNSVFAREAIESLYRVQEWYPFLLFAFVIMPDHCHLLLFIESPREASVLIKKWKVAVSRNLSIGPIWQSRFHLEIIHDSKAALKYVHDNPVAAGLCEKPWDYQWSSANDRWNVDELGWMA